jgi:hypothetical protein
VTTHLYCVLPNDEHSRVPDGLPGLDGAPVRALTVDHLVAWVSDVDSRGAIAISGVKTHDAVVETALATGSTPVPARFGQRFADDDACREALRRQSGAIEAVLGTVQGFVEMTLLLTPSTKRMVNDLQPVLPDMVGDGPGIGRRYLESLRAREAATGAVRQALDALAQRLAQAAHRFIRRVAVQDNLPRMPFRTVSHLISRDLVDQYRAEIGMVHPTGDFRFLIIGPRAPYSFSALGSAGSGAHGMKLAD